MPSRPAPTGGRPGASDSAVRGAANKEDGKSPTKQKSERSGTPTKGRKAAWGGTSRRELQLEVMGENTPGPGSYMPASTFAKASGSGGHATSSSKKGAKIKGKLPTSSFRSASEQRPRPRNLKNPGPGSHSPDRGSTERNVSTPNFARFSLSGSAMDGHSVTEEIGPGAYNTHMHRTLAMGVKEAVEQKSRQNPGFGVGFEFQHMLPHEQSNDANKELPGPGKYETNTSEISKANGHASAFKKPTERKHTYAAHLPSPTASRGRKAATPMQNRRELKASKAKNDTVHV
jgi:hypothetical protein